MPKIPSHPAPKDHLDQIVRTTPDLTPRPAALRLDMNENPSGLPAELVRRVLAGITAADLASYPTLEGLIASLSRKTGLPADHLCPTNGSDAAISHLFSAYVRPGDRVLLTDPTFAMYPIYAAINLAETEQVVYSTDDLTLPLEALVAALDREPRLAVLVNPNNPTGTSLPPELIAELAASHPNTLVLVDEAYGDFDGRSCLPCIRDLENLAVIRTFSKFYALAAVRLGYVAACPEIIRQIRRVRPTFEVNGVAARFGRAVLDDPAVAQNIWARFQAGREALHDGLTRLGLDFRLKEANFALVDPGRDPVIVAEDLADHQVLVAAGFSHPGLRRFMRVTIADPEAMGRFLAALASVLGQSDPTQKTAP